MSAPNLVNATWPDGMRKSLDNAFTLCADGRPHGYVARAPAAPSKLPAKNPRPLSTSTRLGEKIPMMHRKVA